MVGSSNLHADFSDQSDDSDGTNAQQTLPAIAKQKISNEKGVSVEQVDNEGKKSFHPQWDLLIGGKDNNNADDEGDVGSTRQSNHNRRSANSANSKNAGAQLVDVKRNWVKVRYQCVTKRLNNAPKNLDELKIVLWNRFGELRENVNDPGNLMVSAELPKSAGSKSSSDESTNQMPLLTSDDLESFI